MNAATPKRRLIHSITVGPRSTKVYHVGETFQVVYLWEGRKGPLAPKDFPDDRAGALRAARQWAWKDNEPMRAALREFAADHGRAWKAQLAGVWASGADAGRPLLRKARNELGPEWLKKITTDDLEA
jgi:hypothetical protein